VGHDDQNLVRASRRNRVHVLERHRPLPGNRSFEGVALDAEAVRAQALRDPVRGGARVGSARLAERRLESQLAGRFDRRLLVERRRKRGGRQLVRSADGERGDQQGNCDEQRGTAVGSPAHGPFE
jgi:hypothetical protein